MAAFSVAYNPGSVPLKTVQRSFCDVFKAALAHGWVVWLEGDFGVWMRHRSTSKVLRIRGMYHFPCEIAAVDRR